MVLKVPLNPPPPPAPRLAWGCWFAVLVVGSVCGAHHRWGVHMELVQGHPPQMQNASRR